MGSNSSQTSYFEYTVRNQGIDSVKNELKHGENHTLYLKEVWWNYKYI